MNYFHKLFEYDEKKSEEYFRTKVEKIKLKSSITQYKLMNKLNEGSFGIVYKGFHKTTNEIVAIKQLKPSKDGDPLDILKFREIKILQKLKHDNIVNLIDFCNKMEYNEDGFHCDYYLVFEFCEFTLHHWINVKSENIVEMESLMKQCLIALDFVHENNFLHRDLKPENILLTKNGVIKLADFGWSRSIEPLSNQGNLTTNNVTLWYRPPELLLQDTCYNQTIDVWSLACIFCEMYTKEALFKSNNDVEHLKLITKFCGDIDEINWPKGYKLKMKFNAQTTKRSCILEKHLKQCIKNQEMENIIISMLSLNPNNRPNCKNILQTEFFKRINTEIKSFSMKANEKKHNK